MRKPVSVMPTARKSRMFHPFFFTRKYTKCFWFFANSEYTFCMPTCALTGTQFEISTLEKKLLADFDMAEPTLLPYLRIRHLGSLWPNWSLHKRKCDKTGRDMISVFRPECPYPVWHKDEWNTSANPPQAKIDFGAPFFSQAETLFKQSPIPHNSGTHNENCEFTDDKWHSKNCYLSHNGYKCENSRYCGARVVNIRDCLYCAFSFGLEKCIDCVQCDTCYGIVYGLYLRNCRESAFCYDCRNCSDCLLCFNLRNKQYCIGNQQLTKEQFAIQKKQFEYATLLGYSHCKQLFQKMMHDIAWHRCQYVDFSENSSGNYIDHVKNCEDTFFYKDAEDTCHNVRGVDGKTLLDTVSAAVECERLCRCSAVQMQCYDVRCSFQLTEAKFVDYSAYSSQIENCFGCCGLPKGKMCIMNTPYSHHEYAQLRQKLIDHMKSTGEW